MILGLTGSIASGKTTVSIFFTSLGITVIDADILSRELSYNHEIIDKLLSSFGYSILTKTNELNRKALREIAFSSPHNLKILNSIMHPKIISSFEKVKKEHLNDSILVFDIPLLFELNLEYLCDKILLIYTDEATQIKRIIERDQCTYEIAKKILESQAPLENKLLKSDYSIDNSKTKSDLKFQFNKVYQKLLNK